MASTNREIAIFGAAAAVAGGASFVLESSDLATPAIIPAAVTFLFAAPNVGILTNPEVSKGNKALAALGLAGTAGLLGASSLLYANGNHDLGLMLYAVNYLPSAFSFTKYLANVKKEQIGPFKIGKSLRSLKTRERRLI